ncbi:MAG: rhodanese-like domain-containing protein [Deltaproteobacteria bacterium]|nr:MAG: rhodanese-like domain-containing protein [Deltaproteobacteria bacterium]
MRYLALLGGWWIAVVVLALGPVALAGEGSKVEAIAPAEAAAQVKAGKAVVVDVRERGELDAGMAQGAHWYPTSSIQSDPEGYRKFLDSLPQDQTIVFYCASGVRSGKAAEIASKEAGRKAANLGGFKDWKAAALPVTAPAKTLQPG